MNRLVAVWVGVFVTFLWSSSYILNKVAFEEGISTLMLAGLRYSIAVLVMYLISTAVRLRQRTIHKNNRIDGATSKLKMKHYLLLGITGYVMAQGLQYAGQFFISPTQTSMMLSIGNNLLVILLDILWLRAVKSHGILVGIFGITMGIVMYYYPWEFEFGSLIGIGFVLLSSVGYTINLGATRHFMSNNLAETKDLVLRPMFIGAVFTLLFGLIKDGFPGISLKLALILFWLGSINGALAFYLWTWTQKN
ncbi:DMT family transporter [Paenibacillus sp. TH7-28]